MFAARSMVRPATLPARPTGRGYAGRAAVCPSGPGRREPRPPPLIAPERTWSRRGIRWPIPGVFLGRMPICGTGSCTPHAEACPARTSSIRRASVDRRAPVARRRRKRFARAARRCSNVGGTHSKCTNRTGSGADCPKASGNRSSPPALRCGSKVPPRGRRLFGGRVNHSGVTVITVECISVTLRCHIHAFGGRQNPKSMTTMANDTHRPTVCQVTPESRLITNVDPT